MAKILNAAEPYCARLFVSCVNLALKHMLEDKDVDPTLLISVSFLNDTLQQYEQMEEDELLPQLKIEFETEDLSIIGWREYLMEAGAVFAYHLVIGGAHSYTENCLELSKQIFNILDKLK